jgi:phage antirepressor YoqD-like protein
MKPELSSIFIYLDDEKLIYTNQPTGNMRHKYLDAVFFEVKSEQIDQNFK